MPEDDGVLWFLGYGLQRQYACRFYRSKPDLGMKIHHQKGTILVEVRELLHVNEIETDDNGIVRKIFSHTFGRNINSFEYRHEKRRKWVNVGEAIHLPAELIHQAT